MHAGLTAPERCFAYRLQAAHAGYVVTVGAVEVSITCVWSGAQREEGGKALAPDSGGE